jgi:beta-lactamase superfamily II metal-dependent hydrolase
MFRIELLPAQQGDAVWVEYGNDDAPHRVLIDGGTPPTGSVIRERIEQLPEAQRRFDLLVVTHIDSDHIGGVLKLLADPPPGLCFDDVWFNGWRHLSKARSSRLGPIDGEILSDALTKRGWPWNQAFDDCPVMVDPEADQPPSHCLSRGMRLTVLSPGPDQLAKLRTNWKSVVRDAGLDPTHPDRVSRLLELATEKGVAKSIMGAGPPDVRRLAKAPATLDTAVANGSSIALLAEYEGASVLLTADALPHVILDGVRQLLRQRHTSTRLGLSAVKVPHHGSRNNLHPPLLDAIRSPVYLISTSGAIFNHPDDESLARIVWANRNTGCDLYFNYPRDHQLPARKGETRQEWSAIKWDDRRLRDTYRCRATFAGSAGALWEAG